MIKIELKRPIELPTGDRAILRPGIHNMQDDVFSHWFIQGMVNSGDIVVVDVVPSQPAHLPVHEIRVRESGDTVKIGNERVKVEEIKSKVKITHEDVLAKVKATDEANKAALAKEEAVKVEVTDNKSKTTLFKRKKK
jgi:hypothetical protein